MGNWSEHQSSSIVKIMVCGDSGAGKTTNLGHLANAGYKVVIADFANGLDSLAGVLTPEGAENIHYVTFRDNLTIENGINAWASFKKAVRSGDWAGLGKLEEFGEDVVFAVDDLSSAGDAARHYALKLGGKKPHDRPSLPDWGNINDELDVYIMQTLAADSVRCNVVMNTHWQPVDDENGVSRFYPKIGSKNNSVFNSSRHFNNCVWLKANRKGERIIKVSGDASKDLKVSRNMSGDFEGTLADLFVALTN